MNSNIHDKSLDTGQQAAKQLSASLETFLANALDALVVLDSGDRIQYWNRGAERMFGWTAVEALGKTSFEVFAPVFTTQEYQEQEIIAKMKPGENVRGEKLAYSKGGSPIWLEYTVHAISHNNGKPPSYVILYRDISASKRAEEALRKSEERFNMAFHVSPNALVISRLDDGRIETVNKTFLRFFGYTEEEVVGKTSLELGMYVNPADRPEAIERLRKTPAIRDFEIDVRLKSGEIRHVSLSVEVLATGEENAILTTIRDITETNQAEKDMARQRELLERVFENIPVLLVVWEPALQRFTLNHHAEVVLGWTNADANSGDFMSKVYPDPVERAQVSDYMQSLRSGFREIITTAKNGERIPVDWANIRLADATMIGIGVDLRERKRAEESLRAKTEEINTLLQVSPIAFFMAYDPECKRITANPAGYRLVELPQDPGHNISKSTPVEQQPTYRVFRNGVELASQDLPMQTAARLGIEVLEESLELRFEDGSQKFIYAYTRPLTGEDGKPRGAIAAMLDITDHKRMEHEIESIARFPQENPNPVLRIQPDGVISFANAASGKLLGLWKRTVGERLPDEEYRLVLESLKLRKVREQEVDCEGRIYSLIFTPIVDNDYINIYGRDITERNQAEQALRESEERFRNVANTVPSMIWTAAPDGKILYSNENWYQYTGISPEENATDWAKLVLHPNDYDRCLKEWAHALETVPEEYYIEVRNRRHDGEYRWFQTRAIPARDPDGQVVAWYGVTTDIHDRVEAVHAMRESQQQLQWLNETLEQKVDEQTAELRRLTASLTKAEQRERNRIAHILHDDLQQRLYAVKMRLSFLLDRLKENSTLEREVLELDKQIAEILGLTRQLTIELSPPVLHDEGLTQAIEWLAFQMDEKLGLRIEVQADESFALAEEALQVLLFNCVRELLFNIVKHAGVNRAVVSLQRSNDHLRIEVRDEGKGFDVLDPFKIIHPGNDPHDDGKATFGLPTLQHQIGLLGGQLEVRSEPGAGTRITIAMPIT